MQVCEKTTGNALLLAGVAPTVISDPIFSLEADIHISNLKSGTIYGIREASILPVKRTSATTNTTSIAQKTAAPTVANKAHKATFSDGANHYTWSDWIYVVVQ